MRVLGSVQGACSEKAEDAPPEEDAVKCTCPSQLQSSSVLEHLQSGALHFSFINLRKLRRTRCPTSP